MDNNEEKPYNIDDEENSTWLDNKLKNINDEANSMWDEFYKINERLQDLENINLDFPKKAFHQEKQIKYLERQNQCLKRYVSVLLRVLAKRLAVLGSARDADSIVSDVQAEFDAKFGISCPKRSLP
jgi:hypothetical protein